MMRSDLILPFAAAAFSAALCLAGLFRKKHSFASWCFSAGMLAFSLECLFGARWSLAILPDEEAFFRGLTLMTKLLLLGIWLCFSLTYSRGDSDPSRMKFRIILFALLFTIAGLLLFLKKFGPGFPMDNGAADWWMNSPSAGKAINCLMLTACIAILMNLERTFRSSVGTMLWKIKFMILGLGIVFGARIYTLSQALLFNGDTPALADVENGALLIGCTFVSIAFLRSGFSERIDVYPSHAVLRTSLTVLLVGLYLFSVGLLAHFAAQTGGSETFQVRAFVVLLGFALLAVILLSNRIRRVIGVFVSRHFRRPQYDFHQVWATFTRRISSATDQSGLCSAAARLISETFDVLSVSIWLFDEHERFVFGSSTSMSEREASDGISEMVALDKGVTSTHGLSKPFDLERAKGGYADCLRQISKSQFRTGGHRFCVPFWTGDQCVGIAILADRVGGIPYTVEELDLLKCIGDQTAVSLLNLRLTEENMRAKEHEAFQTVSTFFVHDLKNAASTLSLTLQNLPVHFDDPAFRQDALRGIGETANRINQLINRVGSLRPERELNLIESDLNLLVSDALAVLSGEPNIRVVTQLHLGPKLKVDRDQFSSVLTNLLLNARDAVAPRGEIRVETSQSDSWAVLLVADNGCGMSSVFVKTSLFRPFQTTKKRGLGIGMFQSKMIVEAHRGRIHVESAPGRGTTFRIMLPLTLREE